MKMFLVAAATLCTGLAFAQNPINLKKGDKFTVKGESNQTIKMEAFGMTMESSGKSESNFLVTEVKPTSYTVEGVLSKVKVDGSAMGKTEVYDSEDPKTADGSIGDKLKGMVGKKQSIELNQKDATTNALSKTEAKEEAGDPMSGMMQGADPSDLATVLQNIFLPTIVGKKQGDKWSETNDVKGMKVVKNYTFDSMKDGKAVVKLDGTMKGNVEQEAEGQSMTIDMDNAITGTFLVELSNTMIKESTTKMTIKGVLEMMGQSMDLTGDVNSKTTVQ